VLLAEINLHLSRKPEIGLLLNVGIEEPSRFLTACSKSAATVRFAGLNEVAGAAETMGQAEGCSSQEIVRL
jgi:hypothetical protein